MVFVEVGMASAHDRHIVGCPRLHFRGDLGGNLQMSDGIHMDFDSALFAEDGSLLAQLVICSGDIVVKAQEADLACLRQCGRLSQGQDSRQAGEATGGCVQKSASTQTVLDFS